MQQATIQQAFVLGAGLGNRLRPLTEELPKPLIPIFQKPLITFSLDHLIAAGITKFCVNTHHQPQCFEETFQDGSYRGCEIRFRHEPVLLETGGGIANVRDLLGEEPFLVYNADILCDLPLEPLLEEHARASNMVTLALRSHAGPQHIAFDRTSGRVLDIRNLAGTASRDEFVFTGIYAVEPEFFALLQSGVKRSVIPTFIEMIQRGLKLGGIVLDDGHWWDVGTRAAYMQLHCDLPQLDFPRYPVADPGWRVPVHPSANVANDATLRGCSAVGARAELGSGAVLEDTIVWPEAQIAPGAHLRNCVVRGGQKAVGTLCDMDL
jgi:mannose-1-phosphate guanylyltransferase/mannose-1-phosphate guanylyltransferase/phosphomannomutase